MELQKSVSATITVPVMATVTYSASYGEAWEIEDMRKQLLGFAEEKIAEMQSRYIDLEFISDPKQMKITLDRFE